MTDSTGSNGIRLDEKAARGVRRRFERYADSLEAMRDEISKVVEGLDAGTREFGSVMEGGSGVFGVSWQDALNRASRSAAVTTSSINNMSMDLAILDLDVP